jgi:branched-chain amino acid transport system ATP-binding protein
VTLLSVHGLDVRHGLLQAVRNVDLTVTDREILALVGANGAGKTTLLRAIAGAHRPAAGRVIFDGEDVTMMPAHKRVKIGIALVPEGRRLFPGMTVEENLRVAGDRARPGRWTIDAVLEIFPILKPCLKRPSRLLSGGEQQATSIGRALMINPRILLLDELSLGLAPVVVDSLYRSLQGLLAAGTPMILVEQNLNRALGVATRVCCMLEGRIVLDRSAEETTREQITGAYFGARGEARKGAAAL